MSDNIENKSDEELVPLILKNQDDFAFIINRYQEKLMRYIRRISGLEKEDAEDLLQDIFIKVYQNLNGFNTSLRFSSWIYRIAHNQVISNHRKLKARPQTVSYDDEPMLANKAIAKDFLKEIDKDFDRKLLYKALYKLDPKYREVLVLKYIEEKDYSEISDIIQKPVGTVGTLVNRGKKQLKKIIGKNF